MFLGIRRQYWMCLLAAVVLCGLVAFVRLSPVFALQRTDVSGPCSKSLGDTPRWSRIEGQNLFGIDRAALADNLLRADSVALVSIHLTLPDGVWAEVNRFEPVALVLGEAVYGIDRHCRIIPYDTAWETVDLPVLTGLGPLRLFEPPRDFRVAAVVDGLETIAEEMPDLHRVIAEIDFSDRVHVQIYLTTSTARFLALSKDFAAQIFKLYAVRDQAVFHDGDSYNLQYDDVVIKQ